MQGGTLSFVRRLILLVVALGAITGGGRAHGQSDEPADEAPSTTAPEAVSLVPVPVGCEAPPEPHVVFIGTVVDQDYRTTRFEIDTVRAGNPRPFAARRDVLGPDLIDVRYGNDSQFLNDDERYLVSAWVDPDVGLLASRVRPPILNFGGDEVIGVSETDIDCPELEDPIITLHIDGTTVDTSVAGSLFDDKMRLAATILVPFGVAFGVLFLLAMFRVSVTGVVRGVERTVRH